MANPIPVPTLSLSGWVTSPAEKADALLAHWYCSDKAQTFLYGDKVSNIQYLLEQYGNDPYKCMSAMREELQVYLSRYYDAVTIELTSPGTPNFVQPKVELRLFVELTEGINVYSLGKLLQISGGKFKRVVSLNNDGSDPAATAFG